MKNLKLIALLGALVTASIAFGQHKTAPTMDIVDTAVSAKFKTLVAAVQAADLVDALKGKGPFTVFAPTDKAFENLEKKNPGTIAMLLKPENKKKLTTILLLHVVSGKVLASDVVKLRDGTKVKTLGGNSIVVNNRYGVRINGAKLLKTDVMATNGVIHVIDTVLLPK